MQEEIAADWWESVFPDQPMPPTSGSSATRRRRTRTTVVADCMQERRPPGATYFIQSTAQGWTVTGEYPPERARALGLGLQRAASARSGRRSRAAVVRAARVRLRLAERAQRAVPRAARLLGRRWCRPGRGSRSPTRASPTGARTGTSLDEPRAPTSELKADVIRRLAHAHHRSAATGRRYSAVTRYFFFASVSPERAAMNASWGTSTRPTIFIRFLPSFCFSSSLRLRVMSPP